MDFPPSLHPLSRGDHYTPLNGAIIHYVVAGSGPVCVCPAAEFLLPLEKHLTMVWYDTRKTDDIEALRVYLEKLYLNDDLLFIHPPDRDQDQQHHGEGRQQ